MVMSSRHDVSNGARPAPLAGDDAMRRVGRLLRERPGLSSAMAVARWIRCLLPYGSVISSFDVGALIREKWGSSEHCAALAVML
eukprot:10575279-Alexandrium_andersonii.AAC.1